MPFYKNIDCSTPEGRRTAKKLLLLREQLKEEVPERTFEDTILLASWNIREFDNSKYGWRQPESYQYIAEIISHFDIVAIQEVRDTKSLDLLCLVLGGYWKYIVTDVTAGRRGNLERMAYVYDSRKIRFGGLAGELVLPPVKTGPRQYKPVSQISRTPFICGFKSGWSKFTLTSVHILYGTSTADDPERMAEIKHICKFLKERSEDPTTWSQNNILLGDFNIFSTEDPIMNSFYEAGFIIPEGIKTKKSNVAKVERHYDQIALKLSKDKFGFTGNSGVFDFFKTVYREDEESLYAQYLPEDRKDNYYKAHWRTYQMSDHLPIWVELKIDYTNEYLTNKLSQ